jgi:Mg/Co/Ni transporter MgtE
MTDEHHDVIVENEGSGVGALLGIILAIVIVMAIVWFFFLGGQGNPNSAPPVEQPNPPVQIQPPAY